MAGIDMMTSCKCKKGFHENWILVPHWDQTSEWIPIAIIYNKEFAYSVINCWSLVSNRFHLLAIMAVFLTLTIINIVLGFLIQMRNRWVMENDRQGWVIRDMVWFQC